MRLTPRETQRDGEGREGLVSGISQIQYNIHDCEQNFSCTAVANALFQKYYITTIPFSQLDLLSVIRCITHVAVKVSLLTT